MFQNKTTLLKVFGIDIKVAASWVLIAALITWSFADQIFPTILPGMPPRLAFGLGLSAMILFFLSLLLHELAHALTARSFGIKVPTVTLFLFGGVPELGEDPKTPCQDFWIALAGPVMSAALASGFWALAVIADAIKAPPALQMVLACLAVINLVLALLNMLPAFPLDGGRALRAMLWARTGDLMSATLTAARFGQAFGFGLIAIGVMALFSGVHLGGAWQVLIGAFVLLAARSTTDAVRIRQLLGDQSVADLMTRPAKTAHPDLTLADLVNRVMLPNHISFVPVVEEDVLLGHIDTAVLAMIDRENWSNTWVGDVFVRFDGARAVAPDTLAIDALSRFVDTGQSKLFVLDNAQLVGVLTLSDLGRVFQLLTDLHMAPGKGGVMTLHRV
jgi:Zn-dependent protease